MADRPLCHDCLTEDVTVKVTDELGFDHWFCAEDWAAHEELRERIMGLLEDAAGALDQG